MQQYHATKHQPCRQMKLLHGYQPVRGLETRSKYDNIVKLLQNLVDRHRGGGNDLPRTRTSALPECFVQFETATIRFQLLKMLANVHLSAHAEVSLINPGATFDFESFLLNGVRSLKNGFGCSKNFR